MVSLDKQYASLELITLVIVKVNKYHRTRYELHAWFGKEAHKHTIHKRNAWATAIINMAGIHTHINLTKRATEIWPIITTPFITRKEAQAQSRVQSKPSADPIPRQENHLAENICVCRLFVCVWFQIHHAIKSMVVLPFSDCWGALAALPATAAHTQYTPCHWINRNNTYT